MPWTFAAGRSPEPSRFLLRGSLACYEGQNRPRKLHSSIIDLRTSIVHLRRRATYTFAISQLTTSSSHNVHLRIPALMSLKNTQSCRGPGGGGVRGTGERRGPGSAGRGSPDGGSRRTGAQTRGLQGDGVVRCARGRQRGAPPSGAPSSHLAIEKDARPTIIAAGAIAPLISASGADHCRRNRRSQVYKGKGLGGI